MITDQDIWDATNTDKLDRKCDHDLAGRETACADGLCPLCLRAELAAVRADAERERAHNAALQAQVNAFYAGNPQGGIVQRLEAELAAERERAERALHATWWMVPKLRNAAGCDKQALDHVCALMQAKYRSPEFWARAALVWARAALEAER